MSGANEHSLHYEKFADGSVKCIEEEIPFELPDGWAWARFASIADISLGKMLDAVKNKGIAQKYLRNVNVRWGAFDLNDVLEMRFEEDEFDRFSIVKGDLVVCEGGEPGRCAIWDSDEAIFYQKALHRVRPISVLSEFIYYALRAFIGAGIYDRYYTGTTIKHLTGQSIKMLPIPLPPLNEQRRLTEQLDKLQLYIDAIESDKSDVITLIAQTKLQILDLAIRGRLVPQNPSDEPASVLLERIRAEKETLVKAGKIKRDKKESIIFRGDGNSYYLRTENLVESLDDWQFDDLPDSWQICCLSEICDYGSCTNVSINDIDDNAWMLDLEDIEKDSGRVLQKVTKVEREAASTKHRFAKGQVLYSKLRPYLNKVVLADEAGYCTSEILPLEFAEVILPAYARYYLMSPTFLRYANKCSYGVKMPRLGTADGKKAIFPLPPVEEQKRIASAIDAAFGLLDNIASSLT